MLGIRWTIGDANPRGFTALRLSVWGAWRLFGPAVRYRIYVHTTTIDDARTRTGPLPADVEWERITPMVPTCLAAHVDARTVQGVAWRLIPIRAFPDDHELALDNHVVLWAVPQAIEDWLRGRTRFVLAEDVRGWFGRFRDLCGDRPLSPSVRGLPPGFDLGVAIETLLVARPTPVRSELDVQGLQAAAIAASGTTGIVGLDDVTICSPFPSPGQLGRSGAHFVGLDVHADHWEHQIAEVARRVGI